MAEQAAKSPAAKSPAGKPPAAKWPPATPAQCTATVQDVAKAASNQYNAGFARAALTLVIQAMACHDDRHLYRMAGMYACAARDLKSAQLYIAKVPVQFQGAIVQRCQLEGLDLRLPPAAK